MEATRIPSISLDIEHPLHRYLVEKKRDKLKMSWTENIVPQVCGLTSISSGADTNFRDIFSVFTIEAAFSRSQLSLMQRSMLS